MKHVTIEQAMIPSTSTIHDVASQHHNKIIKFPKGTRYAVVLAAYYRGKSYTTHMTERATLKQCKRVKDYSFDVIDSDGNWYDIMDDALVQRPAY